MIGTKTIYNVLKTFHQQCLFKHFMCTVYQPFHDECLKMFPA